MLQFSDVQDQTWVHNGKGDVSFAVIDVHVAPWNDYWIVGPVLV